VTVSRFLKFLAILPFACAASLPTSAYAGGHGGGGFHGGGGGFHGGGFHGGGFHDGFHHDRFFHRHDRFFFGFGGFVGADPFYYSPYYYDPYYYPPTYYVPPAYAAPGAAPGVYAPTAGSCRQFSGDATVDASGQPFFGTACLGADGKWHITG
jgi:hypothetical protein